MKYVRTYSGRLVLAALFFVASSGFTMVLHSCLMADAACCSMAYSGAAPGGSAGHGMDATVSKVASSCCENTVVGGLNRTTATLEQTNPVAAKVVFTAPAFTAPEPSASGGRSFLGALRAHPPDPPSDGLYLTHASLLI